VFLGGVAPGDDPLPDMRTYLLPRSDYRIDDNWRVAGLCGTGSKDIVVEGAFVPEHRTHRFVDAFMLASPGQAVNTSALYRLPFGCVFSSAIAVPVIGAASGALALFAQQARARTSAAGGKVAEDPFCQTRLADASAQIDSAREALRRDWSELSALAEAGQGIPLGPRVRTRFDVGNAVARGVQGPKRQPLRAALQPLHLCGPRNPQRHFRILSFDRLRYIRMDDDRIENCKSLRQALRHSRG
jgi:3-hydroxy-9,10-secoandrosta-1,3,5(10)-triene-9,17-dione monooxygenase